MIKTMKILRRYRKNNIISNQQFKTIKGLVLNGEKEAALKGIKKIKKRSEINNDKENQQKQKRTKRKIP